jgi:hypothetical protein
MDIGEVAALATFMTDNPLCKGKQEPENRGWQCRIGKQGNPGDLDTPSADNLKRNMDSAGVSLPAMPPKKNPHLGLQGSWDLDKCTRTCFPLQSHHLIPKNHLPDHDVCVWLAKRKGNSHWELTESTNFDTDDARNGEPLPFASTTYQWHMANEEEEKDKICNKMMDLTGKQLHQGPHTYDDFGEEDDIETAGYLGAVDQLLKVVNGQTLSHVWFCDDCSKTGGKPVKVRPLERVVESMYQVSGHMRSIITSNRRFVSDRASQFWKKIERGAIPSEIVDSENT